MTFKKIEKVLEEKGCKFEIRPKHNYGYVQLWTAHGWSKTVIIEFNGTPEGFIEKFTVHADSYNADKEAKDLIVQRDMYAKTDKLAEKITDERLLSDCQDVKNKFMNIAAALNKLINPDTIKKTKKPVQQE